MYERTLEFFVEKNKLIGTDKIISKNNYESYLIKEEIKKGSQSPFEFFLDSCRL